MIISVWTFSGEGTSDDPCSENFHGWSPFSEPETKAMSSYLLGLKDQLEIYLTLHSYGQYWLTPWGFTYQVPPDYEDMVSIRLHDTIYTPIWTGGAYMGLVELVQLSEISGLF